MSLRAEVKNLAAAAQQLEPYVKSLTNVQIPQGGGGGGHKTPEQKPGVSKIF